MKTQGPALAVCAALALSACALRGPAPQVTAPAPAGWQAPLPHNGKLGDLQSWWQGQGDALLVELIGAAQQVSPGIASARTRIVQSRADRVAGGAALLPSLDASASVNRMSQQSLQPLGTTSQAALQASWEIDVFGANRATRDAAQARLDSAQAGWHDARVSVAAEVANQYYSLRACQQLLAVSLQDAASRADTARLTEMTAKAGFQSPANAALARASAAEGNSRAIDQRAACERGIKGLVELSAVPETELRRKLAAHAAVAPAGLAIASLPAQVLAQRPDVFSAEREVAAASAEVGNAQAQRYPRLTLSGSVGAANFRSDGVNTSADTWTIGPLSVSLPVFDAGRRRANVDAAAARYDEAVLAYRAKVRQAVREVEQALVDLHSTGERGGDAQTALAGYRASFSATEDRYKNGLASLLELEDARRSRLAAENTVVNLEQQRSAAWIALYRAAGGGWSAPAAGAASGSGSAP
ncbi:efflux transporter outer membrane subunit [Janthinobacterium agaricidamnosum]|uniref:Efflux transporter, outer membrane factor (OMF) lipo, NodT family protein n=1 Tax=Janthinobacterium agaricidamnosum NBRC 102515 = DSM 9628 TaxID=1349767 RepID=W0UYN8_9BURK|nr:efflux transporter outer membrane subunit [Janthinobacterium agaricidamnosum]CDG81684.1 efflux transporter, outer membrane factor (OMF) lipo, NodT family protein [Janthinobacterium agaricidamnosum NBRC 102515 = DSM 9628]